MVDCGGVIVKDLKVAGSGVYTNSGVGIDFYTDLPGDVKLLGVTIKNNEVYGFKRGGISVGGLRGKTGYKNLNIRYN